MAASTPGDQPLLDAPVDRGEEDAPAVFEDLAGIGPGDDLVGIRGGLGGVEGGDIPRGHGPPLPSPEERVKAIGDRGHVHLIRAVLPLDVVPVGVPLEPAAQLEGQGRGMLIRDIHAHVVAGLVGDGGVIGTLPRADAGEVALDPDLDLLVEALLQPDEDVLAPGADEGGHLLAVAVPVGAPLPVGELRAARMGIFKSKVGVGGAEEVGEEGTRRVAGIERDEH